MLPLMLAQIITTTFMGLFAIPVFIANMAVHIFFMHKNFTCEDYRDVSDIEDDSVCSSLQIAYLDDFIFISSCTRHVPMVGFTVFFLVSC